MDLVGSGMNAWNLNKNDFAVWDNFLEYPINKALDYDVYIGSPF